MRTITHIVLHCTATSPSASIEGIKNYWKNTLGWNSPGYHFIIKADGEIVSLWPIDKISNGVKGHNTHSIHISYIGGVDADGNAKDTRTDAQKKAQIKLINQHLQLFPQAIVCGHRDFPNVTKECPSFDARKWWQKVNAA